MCWACIGLLIRYHLVGTDIRKVIADGYAPQNIIACDLRPGTSPFPPNAVL